ncbi:hypothetical protein HNR60_001381 [Rhodopseudomonas rhenobacensis]|uniref:Uncharacterized protein n=1 Tax=Rhodopseudomonas rhenobacensis TaxID=87461 RepID=A0A7W7Z2E4_9BRAD|nr:hypothetical protein [Rhodopseudomonas rhenobacensis]
MAEEDHLAAAERFEVGLGEARQRHRDRALDLLAVDLVTLANIE